MYNNFFVFSIDEDKFVGWIIDIFIAYSSDFLGHKRVQYFKFMKSVVYVIITLCLKYA